MKATTFPRYTERTKKKKKEEKERGRERSGRGRGCVEESGGALLSF